MNMGKLLSDDRLVEYLETATREITEKYNMDMSVAITDILMHYLSKTGHIVLQTQYNPLKDTSQIEFRVK